jgi:hypothetical protein
MSSSEKLSRHDPDQTLRDPDDESDTSEDVEASEMNRFRSHFGEDRLKNKGKPDISELSSI